ncbi:MAG: hypothetical protein HZB23_13730 [Deltaproteobacteria bacterium]|nr:hypothetical protein [Deltaproteobacteria bacterium]
MNYAALSTALARLDDLRCFSELSENKITAVKHLLTLDLNVAGPAFEWANKISNFSPGRTYDYACSIVLLYGVLERFIEEIAEEFITNVVKVAPTYDALPDKLREAHFDLTVSHLQRTRGSRYDGRYDAIQIVDAFSGCLSGKIPYRFIVESMRYHTSNFRVPMVDEFFGRIGIESASRRCVKTDEFDAFLKSYDRIASNERPETVLDLINDLVVRRNEVAHGDTSNVLAHSEIIPYCDMLSAYCKGLTTVINQTFINYIAKYGTDHGLPIAVYNHNIVCIYSRGVELIPGSLLLIKNSSNNWYSVKVMQVQVNSETVTNAPAGIDTPVGLKIDGKCKKSYKIKSIIF